MSELDNLCEFVLKCNNFHDFHIRFNFLINLAVSFFENEIEKQNHLPFNSHEFIVELNKKVNAVCEKINRNKLFYEQGEIVKDVFILIIKEDFPEYFKNYLYQIKFRNN
jgi:hypothetical protein